MLDFIPHYYCRIDPLALVILVLVVVGTLVGWAVCCWTEDNDD